MGYFYWLYLYLLSVNVELWGLYFLFPFCLSDILLHTALDYCVWGTAKNIIIRASTYHAYFLVLDVALSILFIFISSSPIASSYWWSNRQKKLLASHILQSGANLVPHSMFLFYHSVPSTSLTDNCYHLSAFSVPRVGLGILPGICHLILTDNPRRWSWLFYSEGDWLTTGLPWQDLPDLKIHVLSSHNVRRF